MALVVSVNRNPAHGFSKMPVDAIRLIAGRGVEGDAHCGATVKHRSRVAVDPTRPNLRQVHLLSEELFVELAARGFRIGPGDIGENILIRGLDLLGLPTGTCLTIGEALVEVTGLRNPCIQLDRFQAGLTQAVLGRDADGGLVRKAGVMAIVREGGCVRRGDALAVTLPEGPHRPLQPV